MKMENKNTIMAREVLGVLEAFGNLLMFRKPKPWIKEKRKMDQKIRSSWQYYIWRSAVLRKDGYKCVLCGDDRKSVLEVDHIKPFSLFPELRFAIDNGRTLCINCHKKTKTYGGRLKKWS